MHASRILFLWLTFALLLTANAAFSAGGAPSADRGDPAERAYEAGLADRDRAEKLMERASSAGAGQDRLERRARKAWEAAVRHYREAIEEDGQMHQAYSSLGYALRKLGEYGESLAAYDRALSIAPEYPEALEYRGEAYLALGRLEEAKVAYMALAELHPEYAGRLLVAMRIWVTEQRAAGEAGSSAEVTAFEDWLGDRVARAEAQVGAGAPLIPSW